MVRKQNERTLLLQYRITTLSLPTKTLFLILASRPLSTRLGAFSSPETFSHKFFPKFFPIRPRRLFSTFLARKIMRAKHSFRFPNGGGCPLLLVALYITEGPSFAPCLESGCLVSCCPAFVRSMLRHSSGTPPAHRKGESVALVCFLLLESCLPAFIGANFQTIRAKSGKS